MAIYLSDFKNIAGIAVDSRQVKPGFIFVAIKGNIQDGHEYIEQAIANGAQIIVHQFPIKQHKSIHYVQVDDPRIYLSELASQFYAQQPKYILGITGTSGKSSIVHFIREILRLLNEKSVSIGTLGVLGDLKIESSLTTPATIDLHKILNDVYKHHIDYVALECSSHGIDQHRLDAVKFTACGFNNLSHDHLDYHANMTEYFEAKKRLFLIMQNGHAVLNYDIKQFEELNNLCLLQGHKVISYGKHARADILIQEIKNTNIAQEVRWQIHGKSYYNQINLVGEFQIYNLASAIGFVMSTGIAIEAIMSILDQIQSVPGRMELVAYHQDAGILIDYAHKPEALAQALQNLRHNTDNKLWVIFGCGGDRDHAKRPMMGELACQYADHVIITDDNPRDENPASIRAAILANCNDKAIEIPDRENAIAYALEQLQFGDNLLIAGKGHETYQIIGNQKLSFSDKAIVKKLLKTES